MNISQWKSLRVSTTFCSLLISSLVLSACGGGTVASVILSGIGGTGIVFGPITGFGSVYAKFLDGDRSVQGALYNDAVEVPADFGGDQGQGACDAVHAATPRCVHGTLPAG